MRKYYQSNKDEWKRDKKITEKIFNKKIQSKATIKHHRYKKRSNVKSIQEINALLQVRKKKEIIHDNTQTDSKTKEIKIILIFS